MCTVDPFLEECEYAEASMKKKKPRENYKGVSVSFVFSGCLDGQVGEGRTRAPAR